MEKYSSLIKKKRYVEELLQTKNLKEKQKLIDKKAKEEERRIVDQKANQLYLLELKYNFIKFNDTNWLFSV